MNTINKYNYEIWFLDFKEGNLGEHDKQMVLSFIREHPELKPEFDSFNPVYLQPEEVVYPHKGSLKRTVPFFVLYGPTFRKLGVAVSVLLLILFSFLIGMNINADRVKQNGNGNVANTISNQDEGVKTVSDVMANRVDSENEKDIQSMNEEDVPVTDSGAETLFASTGPEQSQSAINQTMSDPVGEIELLTEPVQKSLAILQTNELIEDLDVKPSITLTPTTTNKRNTAKGNFGFLKNILTHDLSRKMLPELMQQELSEGNLLASQDTDREGLNIREKGKKLMGLIFKN
jgi:hypothetical protein